jgi:hypothetical protein
MNDADIVHRIGVLADEEHEVTLDQCWDLLRQRRARRAAGQDPDDVAVRPEEVVEHYRQ